MTITGLLSEDHDRLDALLAQVVDRFAGDDLAGARACFDAFDVGLRRHIRYEEGRLFPLWSSRTGITGGPITVMLLEHREIERALDGLRRGLESGDPAVFGEAHRRLGTVLPAHNLKEERVLYAAIDEAITPAEGQSLKEAFGCER